MKTISKPKSPLQVTGRLTSPATHQHQNRSYASLLVVTFGVIAAMVAVAFITIRVRANILKLNATIKVNEDAYSSLARKHVASLVGRARDLSLDPMASKEHFGQAIEFADSSHIDDLGARHQQPKIVKLELPENFNLRKIRSSSGTQFTTVDLVVEDQSGHFISNLSRNDFDVFLGENRLSHVVAEQITLSISRQAVSILRDRSGSVGGEPDHRAALGIKSLVSTVTYPTTVRYWEFADSVNAFSPWTTDPQIIITALEGRVTNGGTALYRSIRTAVADLATRKDQRVLIVFTDGNDSLNSESIDEVIRQCNLAKVKVFVVALKSAELREDLLRRIASETDGNYFAAANPSEIESHFRRLAQSLQQPAYRIIALHDRVTGSKVTVRIGNKELSALN